MCPGALGGGGVGTCRCALEEDEPRAVRVGGDREPPDAGNVLGPAMDRAAGRGHALRIGVDVVDPDIAHPGRAGAGLRASSGIGIRPPTIAGPIEKIV